jgi:anti-anti-sigma factor
VSITQEPTPGCRIVLEEHPAGLAVSVDGEVDLANADALEEMLDSSLTTGREVVVDLSRTTFIDSYGLAVIHRTHARAVDQGVGLRLVCPETGLVRRTLALTQLDHLLDDPAHRAAAE